MHSFPSIEVPRNRFNHSRIREITKFTPGLTLSVDLSHAGLTGPGTLNRIDYSSHDDERTGDTVMCSCRAPKRRHQPQRVSSEYGML